MENTGTPVYTLTQAELVQLIRSAVKAAMAELLDKGRPAEREEIIKIKDVCKMLGVSKVTVFAWIKQGKLPCHHLGTRLYFKRQEILNALTRNDITYGQRKKRTAA